MYMTGIANSCLYTLNVTTGVATRIGSATQFGVGEDSVTDILSFGGRLYMVGKGTDKLYTLNVETGVATVVNSSITKFGVNEDLVTGIGLFTGPGVVWNAIQPGS